MVAGASGLMTTVDRIGEVSQQDLDQAATFINGIPQKLHETAHDTFGCRAVIYLLLLDSDNDVRGRQIERLESQADQQVISVLHELLREEGQLARVMHLPLLEICLPALRRLSEPQGEKDGKSVIDPNIAAAIEEMERVLGTRVKLVTRGEKRGRIEIEYYSGEDLDRIYEAIVGTAD